LAIWMIYPSKFQITSTKSQIISNDLNFNSQTV
jgi:hypothetical protein